MDTPASERLAHFDALLSESFAHLNAPNEADRRAPDTALLHFLTTEHTFLVQIRQNMDTATRNDFANRIQPLFSKFTKITAEVQRTSLFAPTAKRLQTESPDERLKSILQAESERTAQHVSILKTNTEQLSVLGAQHQRIGQTLQSAVGHIRTLQRIQWTEDTLERVAKLIFVCVCAHVCLSRFGVYWLLSALGVRGALSKMRKMFWKMAIVAYRRVGHFSRDWEIYSKLVCKRAKPYLEECAKVTYPVSMWLIEMWISVMLISTADKG